MRNQPQFKMRFPEDLKKWLEEQAQKNCRSQTAEIVYRLTKEMQQQKQAAA